MTQYGFYFDGTRCTGCKTCTLSCKDRNNLRSEQAFRQVYEYTGGTGFKADDEGCWIADTFAYYVSSACNHCENPACVSACPQKSMTKNEETGLVYNDPETCIGCGTCASICPYGAPAIDDQTKVSIKCDGCHERVEAGLAPICVESCPQRALEFDDVEKLRSTYGNAVQAIAPLPSPASTNPSVIIAAPAKAEHWDSATGEVENEVEIV